MLKTYEFILSVRVTFIALKLQMEYFLWQQF